MVSQDRWEGVIDLPTDVLLRTTSHEGRTFDELAELSSLWTFMTPMEEHLALYLFEAALFGGRGIQRSHLHRPAWLLSPGIRLPPERP